MKIKRSALGGKNKNKTLFFCLALPVFLVVFFIFWKNVFAVNHTGIINEIQTAGASANDEFIELYDTADTPVNLSGWSIQYRGGSGANYYKKNFENNSIIPAKRFFLIAHGGNGNYSGATTFDMSWSQSLSSTGGTIFLVNNQTLLTDGASSSIVDKVSYGAGAYLVPENLPAIKPESNQSIERKNFQDTDDNSVDFSLLDTSTPQNSTFVEDSSGEEEEQEDTVSICKDKIVLSEIFPFTGEFVEVENMGSEKCDLTGWKIGDEKNSPHPFPAGSIINPGEYLAFIRDFYLNSSSPDSARLFDPINNEPVEVRLYEKPENNYSYSKNESGEWKWTSIVTSGKKNEFDVPKIYSDKIQITELLPDPNDGDDEFIELYNGSGEKIDLKDWSLHDASQSGEYIFIAADSIATKEYLAIYKTTYGFALNNSSDESVTLFDPNKKEIFKVSYDGSKKGVSYNFDGANWHWSKFLTPGKENIFNNEPYGTVKIDDDVYVNVYTNFSISTGDVDGDAVDVTWDFGDGHKSYLAKTKHKYTELGKYDGTVKLSDGSEDVIKNFTVDVGEVPHPNVKIVSINANPKGSDTGNESITLQNKSKKKVNLNGWSIATGWKKLTNHPISEDFEIKSDKTKEITHEFSKFTLNNVKSEIELRYPDGEVASAAKYNKKKGSVAEGEVYARGKKGWKWIVSVVSKKIVDSLTSMNQEEVNNPPSDEAAIDSQEVKDNKQENVKDDLENISDEDIIMQPKIKRENKLALNYNNIFKIELLDSAPHVLGVEDVREIDGRYYFTPQYTNQDHYVIIFLQNIFAIMNLKINMLVNYFLN